MNEWDEILARHQERSHRIVVTALVVNTCIVALTYLLAALWR